MHRRRANAPARWIGSAQMLVIVVMLIVGVVGAPAAQAADADASSEGPWALFGPETVPSEPPATDDAQVELGVRFSVAQPAAGGDYRITAVRFYRDPSRPMIENRVFVYDGDGQVVAHGAFTGEGGPSGVIDVQLEEPVTLTPGETYTASYLAPDGGYSFDYGSFEQSVDVGPVTFPIDAGVFRYGGGFPCCSVQAASYYVSPLIELDTGVPAPTPRPPVDATIPTVNILDPSDLATVPASRTFYVRGRMTDDGGILRETRLLVDGSVVNSVQDPWTGSTVIFPVSLPAGVHSIAIQAEDPAGNVGEDKVQVTAVDSTD